MPPAFQLFRFRPLTESGQFRFQTGKRGLQGRGLGLASGIKAFAEWAFAVTDAGKDGLHGIIVLLQDRIKFVIVAAGTSQGQAQKGGAGGIDHVGQFVFPLHQGK